MKGLNYLCNKLLSDLLGEDLHIDTAQVIPCFVTRRLMCKKVFIVLDNVNSSELVENLVGVGREWLGAGSRVIVTTREISMYLQVEMLTKFMKSSK